MPVMNARKQFYRICNVCETATAISDHEAAQAGMQTGTAPEPVTGAHTPDASEQN